MMRMQRLREAVEDDITEIPETVKRTVLAESSVLLACNQRGLVEQLTMERTSMEYGRKTLPFIVRIG